MGVVPDDLPAQQHEWSFASRSGSYLHRKRAIIEIISDQLKNFSHIEYFRHTKAWQSAKDLINQYLSLAPVVCPCKYPAGLDRWRQA